MDLRMTEPDGDNDMSVEYARQRAGVDASLGRVFRNASQLAAYWDGRPADALLRRAPKQWDAPSVEERDYVDGVSHGAAWTSKEVLLQSFLDFARRRPVVASVLALTAGAVAIYAMKLASQD